MKSADSSAAGGSPGRNSDATLQPGQSAELVKDTFVIRIEAAAAARPNRLNRWLAALMIASLLMNFVLVAQRQLANSPESLPEKRISGDARASDRIAVINFTGTISPPFTERWLRQIKQAAKDTTVRGVVLAIDSPGGLVADSHQLYTELQKLAEVKPIHVAMKRLAASGGYYIAMGIGQKGRIYAEPTTWTGSIGVIIPRYNATELAKNLGVKVEPLMTGSLKDTLNPFRDMTEPEREVWNAILKDSFDRFVSVISENRSQLDEEAVRKLATGQIYTSRQALENHMVDEIGYVEDATKALASELSLTRHEVFEYRDTPGLIDLFLGAETRPATSVADQLLDAAVPRAMYYCSWNPWVPVR